MSYDLTFVRKAAGQSWEEAFEAEEERVAAEEPGDAPDARVWEAVLAGAREMLGEVTVFRQSDSYELDHDATGIQLSLWSDSAGIAVPYWYRGADALRVVQAIYELGRVVERHTGLAGYDAQVELPIAEAAAQPQAAVTCFDQVADSFARRGISSPGDNA